MYYILIKLMLKMAYKVCKLLLKIAYENKLSTCFSIKALKLLEIDIKVRIIVFRKSYQTVYLSLEIAIKV